MIAVSAAACTASPALPPDGGGLPWQQALDGLSRHGGTVYSFTYDGPPPTGEFYTLAVHDVDPTAACSRYGATSTTGNTTNFWELAVTIHDEVAGDHAITVDERQGDPAHTANVTLLHRRDGAWVEAYDALSGSVTLTTTPSAADAKAGADLAGRIDAEFPSHAVMEESCQGGGPTDGGAMWSSCTCKDAIGVATTCTPSGGQECCRDWASPRIHVTLDFDASSCPAMCRWVAGLPVDYCQLEFGS
jgi:hypothetical protein